jgi:hypothetical protein
MKPHKNSANKAKPAPGQQKIKAAAPIATPGELTAQTAKNQSANEPLLVRVIQNDERTYFERYGGLVVASLALLAACVTAYFTYGQLEAAQTSIKQSTDAFKIDEQARIRILSVELGWDSHGDHVLTANIKFSNVGKTQAEIVAIDRHVGLTDDRPNLDGVTFTPTLTDPDPSSDTLYTGDERISSAFDSTIPLMGYQELAAKKKLIAGWGCIEYKDIFGEHHWSDFCAVRQPAPNDSLSVTCAYKCQRNPKHPNY